MHPTVKNSAASQTEPHTKLKKSHQTSHLHNNRQTARQAPSTCRASLSLSTLSTSSFELTTATIVTVVVAIKVLPRSFVGSEPEQWWNLFRESTSCTAERFLSWCVTSTLTESFSHTLLTPEKSVPRAGGGVGTVATTLPPQGNCEFGRPHPRVKSPRCCW